MSEKENLNESEATDFHIKKQIEITPDIHLSLFYHCVIAVK